MRKLIVILIPSFITVVFAGAQTLVADTIYYSNGAKTVTYRNVATTTTPTTSRLNDSIAAVKAWVNTNPGGYITVVPAQTWASILNKPTIPANTNELVNGAGFLTAVPAQAWASITGKPTTRAGYGITDAAADNHTHAGVYEPVITTLPFAKGGISTSAATPATTGTMTVSMTSSIITITPTGACTFNASGGVAGQIVTFSITTSGVSSFVLTWGTNFRKTGTLATGTTSARFFTVTFRCLDGTIWSEIGRTAAQT